MPITAAQAIVRELKPLGSEGYCKILRKHGIRDPLFGVKISELKKIQKRVKRSYEIAIDLYDTGIYDAMYLAGLIADDMQMSKKELQSWADKANCTALASTTVAWVTAGGQYGWELAIKWIESKKLLVACAGWGTLCALVKVKPDSELDTKRLQQLLLRVQNTIHDQPNELRSVMNHFVIEVGCNVRELTEHALRAARSIGVVVVDVGETECKVPSATDYIHKAQQRGTIGKKRKTAKC